MGKFSRDKGKRGEREYANLIKPFFPDARRGASQSRSGSDAPDVVAGANFWHECKIGKRTNPKAALEQASEAKPDHMVAIAYTRDDYKKGIISLYAEDFLKYFGKYLPEIDKEIGSGAS